MAVIHRELYQVLGVNPDGVNTFTIESDHPWIAGQQPGPGQRWAWNPSSNEPVLVGINQFWNHEISQFEDDQDLIVAELTSTKNKKVKEFREICGDRISLPFTSNALGTEHIYRNNRDDQLKIKEASENATGGYIWSNEEYLLHTQEQAQLVRLASKSQIDSVTLEYAGKYTEIKNALTKDDVDSITWSE